MSSHGPHHRAFSISHQRVILEVQLDGQIKALTEITILPLSAELSTVHLHSNSCSILNVYHPTDQGNQKLDFLLNEPFPIKIPDPNSVRQYPEAKRRLFERVNEKETGELVIQIDRSKINKSIRQLDPIDLTTPSGSVNNQSNQKEKQQIDFEPIIISIEYQITLKDLLINHAICIINGHHPIVFTNSTSARSWVPCLDSLWERCPWELNFIVPKFNSNSLHQPIIVVSSGELIEQVIHPLDSSKSLFHYSLAIPTSVQHIAWAVGALKLHDLTPNKLRYSSPTKYLDSDHNIHNNQSHILSQDQSSNQINLHAFSLSNKSSQLINTVQFLPHALSFFSQEYGSYPYSSYKVVFLDMSSATHSIGMTFNSATLTLYPSDLLYSAEIIDQVYETKPTLVHSLASQWIGINIIPKSPSDTWLINGLSLYITGLYFKSIWGTNEYRYKIKKDMLKCVEMDVNKAPICQPGLPLAIDTQVLGFVNLKASLVLYILDRHLRRSGGGTSLGLSRVIPKIFLSAISGEMRDNMLSTNSFLRICRKLSGTELKSWADQWIYASGCPVFEVSAQFNRKKMTHELNLKQLNPSKSYYDDPNTTWEEKCNLKPLDRFEGPMTVRIHESDGVPYEHVLDIKEIFKRYELPSNHKNKKGRRPIRRYNITNQSGENVEVSDDRLFDKPWQRFQDEPDSWKFVDWVDDEEINQSNVEWIRLDVEAEWICEIRFEMKEYMWLEQLQKDRDVIAQLEAVKALSCLSSKVASSHLCRAALTFEYFFRIRVEAVLALVSCANSQCGFLGLFHLLKLFQTQYCFPPKQEPDSPWNIRAIPKPNQFDNFADYFIRKALTTAIAQVRDQNYNSPAICQQFFLDQLIYNDNSVNRYSDVHYIATLIAAMSDSFIHMADVGQQKEFSEFSLDDTISREIDTGSRDSCRKRLLVMVNELERFLVVDRLVPSYRNIITMAVVEAKLKLMFAGLLPVDLMFFLVFTRPGNYPPLRILAFDCLLLLRGFQEKAIVRYMFLVMRDDQSLLVRRRLAMALVQCLPILVFAEELGGEPTKQGFSVLDKPDDHANTKSKLDQKAITKHLRVEVGRALILRECIMSVMLHPSVDVDVQTCLLKISEVLFKPSDESVPICIPIEPLQPLEIETPILPKIRIPATLATIELPLPPAPLPKIILKDNQFHPPNDDLDNVIPVPSVPTSQEAPLRLIATLTKKSKPGPKPKKFQASGMSIPDHKMCQNLLKKIASHPLSIPFRKAVDPIRDGAPNYFNIITRPMDFKTMGDKLEMGQYPNRQAFRDDFNLVLENCKAYNLADSPLVLKHAEPMKVIFDKLWERSEKTMNALQAKGIGGGNVGWLSSSDTKPLVPPTNILPLAPPPSFAAFAAGGSMIPMAPPPPNKSPSPLPSAALSNSPEASKPSGLKVKLKPRTSISIGTTLKESPSNVHSTMPPPASKSTLRIKFSPCPTTSSHNISLSPAKSMSDTSKITAYSGPTFPVPPPPSFPLTSTPIVSMKSRAPAIPTFPVPPPPTLDLFSLSSKPPANTPPALPHRNQSSPVPESLPPPSSTLEKPTFAAPLHSPSSLPQDTIPNALHGTAISTSNPPLKKPTLVAKLSRPPPPPSAVPLSVPSSQTSILPNFPAPPPPSIPQLGLISAPATSSTDIIPSDLTPKPSNPTKIKVIQRPLKPPISLEADSAAPLASPSAPTSSLNKPKTSKKSKPNNNVTKVASISSVNARLSSERSRSSSIDPSTSFSTPPPPPASLSSVSPSIKKPQAKKVILSNNLSDDSFSGQQLSTAIHKGPIQSVAQPVNNSLVASNGSTGSSPIPTLAQPVGPIRHSAAAKGGSPTMENVLVPKKAKGIIRKMMESPYGAWFRVPVDPIAVGAPTYYDEIKSPMDLTTMQKKVDKGVYKRLSELMADFDLIVSNCIQFNGAFSEVAAQAKALEKAWKTEWQKASKMSYIEKRSLLGLFNKLNQVAGVDVFSEPVDPVALQIPTYFSVIGGKQNARDLGTIKSNLVADRYNNIQEFEVDIRLMLKNCFTFNPPESLVSIIGKDLEKVFDAGILKIKKDSGLISTSTSASTVSNNGGTSSSLNKRKGNEGGNVPKKTKVG
ncbi:hypothetical protein O181_028650 [Austropuccinia psidii MF-1]|uniref:Transcription initiation factor TFIID subunit 2 n=1 Tax=Austropuccinia psidii MF-1 TaxID=1389203 RepID=A0A9Q3H4E5_9BASI|nr:hypothetical protein [Austropuccinia psidii MF-1]